MRKIARGFRCAALFGAGERANVTENSMEHMMREE